MNKTRNFIIGTAIIVVIIFIIYTGWILTRPIPVEIQGEVEATQIKVASKLVGRIDSLPIRKGMDVKKGDFLFRIYSPEVEAKLGQAEAAKSMAEAQSLKAQNGAQSEDIEIAHSQYLKANAAANLMQRTFNRTDNLFRAGVVSEQKRDEVETKLIAAKKTAESAKKLWEKAQKGARNEDKETARALVNKAQSVIQEVESYMSERVITAPMSGEISNIIAEQGELISSGLPVVTIVDLNDVWVTFNVNEDKLANITKGSEIEATFPALGNKKVLLKVTYINVLGSYANWNATKARGDFDRKTFEVHARPVKQEKGLRPGMSALVDWSKL